MIVNRTIPGPRGRLLTGNLKEVQEDPLAFLLDTTRTFGDVSLTRAGPMRFIVVNHPDHAKHVLQSNNTGYGRPPLVAMLRRLVGNGLLFSEGELWLRQRRTMQPMFRRERITGFSRIMGEAVSARVRAWRERSADDPLDLSRETALLTFEIVGRALFSTDLSAEARALGDAIQFVLWWLDDRTVRPLAAPPFVPTADNRRFWASKRLLAEQIARMLAERRSASDDPGDLMSMLLAARDPETGEGMDEQQIHDELIVFLVAGHETTAAALEWTMLLLARHPEAAQRIRDEQHAVCGDRPPEPADLPNMPYTRAVIDESLRLYPPVYGLSRRALAEDEIGGYAIPKGSTVLVSPYALHRHPGLWEDPDRFDPERFLPERAEGRSRYAHIPFGAGPRVCIGNAFAMMELQVLVPTLIGAFRFEPVGEVGLVPQPRMTLRAKGPIYMHPRPL